MLERPLTCINITLFSVLPSKACDQRPCVGEESSDGSSDSINDRSSGRNSIVQEGMGVAAGDTDASTGLR